MRTFEIVLLVAVAAAIFVPAATGERPRRGVTAGVLIAAIAVQILLEGYRWQLVPLYVAAAGLAAGDLLSDRRVLPKRIRRSVLGAIGIGALAILPIALPVPTVPQPTGSFEVGTASFEIVDTSRQEVYGENPGGPRRIMVQVWYPAVESASETPVVSPWVENLGVVGPALSRQFGFPGFMLDHTRYTDGHAHPGAEPLADPAPVVVYSHGWRGFRNVALNQMESLASHGFMVVAVDHTYGSIAVEFPDGTVAELDEDALPDSDAVGDAAYEEATETLVATYSGDVAAVLDALEMGSAGPFGSLSTAADLDRVGVFGHSTGGGAAVRVCIVDDRCDAVLGHDAWVEPVPAEIRERALSVPALLIRSDGWRGTDNDVLLRRLAESGDRPVYWLGLVGASHQDFVLPPMFSPISDRLGVKGPIPAERAVKILDDYLVGFFSTHLLGTAGTTLDETPPPEVEFELIS